MKILKNSKKLLPFVIFALAAITFSSCNRGVGCPTFSIGDTIDVLSTQQSPAELLFE